MKTYFFLLVLLFAPIVGWAGVSDVELKNVTVSREVIIHGEDTRVTFDLDGISQRNYDVVATLYGFGGVRVGAWEWRGTDLESPFMYHVVGMPPSDYYLHIAVLLPHSGRVIREFDHVGPFTILKRP
jgi:hypothetical protein